SAKGGRPDSLRFPERELGMLWVASPPDWRNPLRNIMLRDGIRPGKEDSSLTGRHPVMTPATLLVVEDEAVQALDLRRRVVRLGYAVAGVTGTGAEAIRLAELHRPDLVLMDIGLQGDMDGVT